MMMGLLSHGSGAEGDASDEETPRLVSAVVSRMSEGTIARFVVAQRHEQRRDGHRSPRRGVPDARARRRSARAHAGAGARRSRGVAARPDRGVSRRLEPRRREAADVVLGRAVRVGRLRPRAVARPHAGDSGRAGQRRSARTADRLDEHGGDDGAAGARPDAAPRPAADRARPRALERADDAGRPAARGSAARRRLRGGRGARRRAGARGRPGPGARGWRRPAADGDQRHRHARRRLDDAPHRHAPGGDRRRAVRAREGDVPVARRSRRAADRRGAVDRGEQPDARAADGDHHRARRGGAADGRAAEELAERRGAAHGGRAAAPVRRQRGAARPHRAARRQRAAGAARSGAGDPQHRHRSRVPHARAGAGERHDAVARGDHAVDQQPARRARGAALHLHPAPRRSPRRARHDLSARDRIARRAAGSRERRAAEGGALPRRVVGAAPDGDAAAAAAAALARIGTPEARAVLEEAASTGSRGVRSAARAHAAASRGRAEREAQR